MPEFPEVTIGGGCLCRILEVSLRSPPSLCLNHRLLQSDFFESSIHRSLSFETFREESKDVSDVDFEGFRETRVVSGDKLWPINDHRVQFRSYYDVIFTKITVGDSDVVAGL